MYLGRWKAYQGTVGVLGWWGQWAVGKGVHQVCISMGVPETGEGKSAGSVGDPKPSMVRKSCMS